MKPLFTVHAGEYLAGEHIEQHFGRVNLWIPSRDTGVDLLVSDRQNRRTVSLQVNFSKDYLATQMAREPTFLKKLRACGWWTIKEGKLDAPAADVWVFVLPGLLGRTTDFVIVPTTEFRRRLRLIYGSLNKRIDSHLWVTERDRCWETRGLHKKHLDQIAEGEYEEPRRDFTKWLNNWGPVAQLNRQQPRQVTSGNGERPPGQAPPSSDPLIESQSGRSNDS
jgi:hypothetical protein